jgi:hypothetical protein
VATHLEITQQELVVVRAELAEVKEEPLVLLEKLEELAVLVETVLVPTVMEQMVALVVLALLAIQVKFLFITKEIFNG